MEELWNGLIRFLVILIFAPLVLCLMLQAALALIVVMLPVLLALVLLLVMSGGLYLGFQGQHWRNPWVLGALFLVLACGAVTLYMLAPFVVEALPWLVGLMGISSIAYSLWMMAAGRHKAGPRLRGTERTPFVPQNSSEEEP